MMDAGVMDAGVMDAGVMDAGVMDAGVMDAGVMDAGVMDAGVTDAGASDAGPMLILPSAVIGPLPARVLYSTQPFQLDGLGSTGFPAISRYTWSVDTGLARLPDGGVVTLSPNDSGVAWAPTLSLPLPPALVSVTLRVTDLSGTVSAPATAAFVVGDRPLALFDAGSLPSTLYGNQTVVIDATPSRDPMNSGLASRRWAVSAGAPVTTSALDGGATLTLTTQAVPATQMVTVSHWVTNGLGFESLERTHTFTAISGPVPMPTPWAVTTAGALMADGGTFVSLLAGLDAGGNGPLYADPMNYAFSWTSLTDAGSPPRFVVGNPNAQNTSVYLPIIEGPPQRYDFQVTASTNPPLTPGTSSANLSVLLFDRQRPAITGASASATGSAMGVTLDFSEPMDVGPSTCLMSVGNASCSVGVLPSQFPLRTVGKLTRNERVLYVTRPPFLGEVWRLQLTQPVTDVVGNALVASGPALSVDYAPEHRWTPLYLAATGDLSLEPRPGLSVVATPTLAEHLARVSSHDGVSPAATSTGVLSLCPSLPCPTSTAALGASGAPVGVRPNAFTVDGVSYYQPLPGVVFAHDGGATAQVLPAAPGPVFLEGRGTLATVYASSGTLRLASFVDGGWDFANELPVQDAGVPASPTVTAATFGAGSSRVACATWVNGSTVRVLTKSTAAFGSPNYNNPPLGSYAVKEAWVYSLTSGRCHVAFIGADDRPAFIEAPVGDFSTTGNIQYPPTAFTVSSMDVALDPYLVGGQLARWWAVVDQSGQLDLYYTLATQALGPSSRVPPPGGASSLNANPACIAAHPRVVALEQAVYVAWQERCTGQPWRVYLRGLH
ncbi:MAG: hypothetical protein IAE78_29035 [Myxococcus sp.]|nr:hypothetical protein [Myxococcus sp.]